MAVLDQELLSFWKKLNQNKVRYIMVGGVAAILHGHNRLTEDVDVGNVLKNGWWVFRL